MAKILKVFQTVVIGIMMTALFSSCLKNYNSTIALPEIGTAANVIPEEIREEFESKMDIYEGTNPPDITCSFVISDFILSYSSDGASSGKKYADQYMRFYNKNGNTYEYMGTQGTLEEYSPSVVVVGSGNNFTAYYVSTSNHSDGDAWTTEANLISGRITSDGIEDVTYAFIILDKYDPDQTIMGINEYRIFYDGDGLADYYDWEGTKSFGQVGAGLKNGSKSLKSTL